MGWNAVGWDAVMSAVDASPPYRVCFVCTGNICRSPTAEAVFRALVRDAGLANRVVVDSAGTDSWHVGAGADVRSLAALVERGYRLDHRARQFGRDWFDRYDLVVALDGSHASDLHRWAGKSAGPPVRLLRSYDPDSVASGDLDVPDPYYGGPNGFTHVLDVIEAGCRGLLEQVRRELPG